MASNYKYELHTVLRDDFNEGWIWVKDKNLQHLEGRRRIVKVGYKAKHIYCELLYATKRDINRFNEHFCPKIEAQKIEGEDSRLIFISTWYRNLLGIPKECLTEEICVSVKESNSLRAYFCVCLQHPQAVVLLATVLAFIGVGLGFIGAGLGIIGIPEWRPVGECIGRAVVALGVLLSILSVLPLFRRAWRTRSYS